MSENGLFRRASDIKTYGDSGTHQGGGFPVVDVTSSHISPDWLENQQHLAAPVLILDAELTIIWRNDAFRRFRETEGLEYRGRPIYALFTTFAEREAREKLIESLRNPERGFGWHGEVVGRGPKGRQFVAKLEIGPTESCGKGLPGNYRACLHDETEIYKTKTQRLFYTFLQGSLLKDEDTGNHVGRVNAYSRAIAAKLKGNLLWIDVDDDYIEDIGILAAFHDVGKFGTPDSILQKPGKLTEEEWQAMKEHPIQGAMLLAAHPNPMVRDIARSHHERWDGSGYPYGLEKEDIPLSARIVAIADVYDALRTRRAYKEPFTEEQTFGVIVSESGNHFDPDLIEIFKEIRTVFDEIFTTLADGSGTAVNPRRED